MQMRRRFLPLGLALLGLLSGCLHLEQVLYLRKDGTGLITYDYSLPEDQVATLSAARRTVETWQADDASAPGQDLNWFLSEAAARRHFRSAHSELQYYRKSRRDGRLQVSLRIYVRDIRRALRTGRFGDLRVVPGPGQTWVLEDTLPRPQDQAPPTDAQRERLEALSRGLRLVLRVEAPADVRGSTATTVDGRTAVWVFDPAEDPAFLESTPRIHLVLQDDKLRW